MLVCPPPGDLPDPGIESACPAFPALMADSLPLAPPGELREGLMVRQILQRITLPEVKHEMDIFSYFKMVVLANYFSKYYTNIYYYYL